MARSLILHCAKPQLPEKEPSPPPTPHDTRESTHRALPNHAARTDAPSGELTTVPSRCRAADNTSRRRGSKRVRPSRNAIGGARRHASRRRKTTDDAAVVFIAPRRRSCGGGQPW